MAYPVLYVPAGDVVPIPFTTYVGATGASVTMSGLAVTDIEIYKDGSTTQRASDAGYTLLDTDGIDFDGVTGLHGFSIDTGDDTDAGFYAVGAWYWVVVSAVTVDSQTVTFIAALFRITAAENSAGVPDVHVISMEDGVITAAKIGADAITNAKIADNAIAAENFAADAITAAKLAADVTTELQSGLATAAALTTLDGKADDIKAKTDSLTFTVAGEVDANMQSVNGEAVTGDGSVGDPWNATA
jgi:hypothetical protein